MQIAQNTTTNVLNALEWDEKQSQDREFQRTTVWGKTLYCTGKDNKQMQLPRKTTSSYIDASEMKLTHLIGTR